MEENKSLYPQTLEEQPDLDDLIFSEEIWLTSDR